ncbi:MAG: glycoside hydrolase family 15 protein [Clostridia bacterium]|nr:glycoside hydrolase family 15 protein [Clostridia bacterium]
MTKTYFNNAIVGNSRMLGCLSDRGELVRLFWPHIDYPQHIDRMSMGLFFIDQVHSTMWLESECFQHNQHYIEDTNIIETLCSNYEKGLKVKQTDFCLPDKDILVRQYEIENFGVNEIQLGFVSYSGCVTTTPELRSSLFDFDIDALIHYRHGYYISVSADREAYQFQLGNNAFESAKYTQLGGYDNIGMMPDGAVSWKLGTLKAGQVIRFTLNICAAATLKEVKKMAREFKAGDSLLEQEKTKQFWRNFISECKPVHTGNEEIDALYRRTLLVFKLTSDEKSGGLLAAPEIDENFTRCGRYGYCWGRDAAFITGALDKCGLYPVVDKFYDWAMEAQDDNGSWQQRFHMDGNLAPSWGLQVDETGTLIWGMLEHYRATGNREFLAKVWDSVERAVSFLTGFIDIETGLPKPSYDLWEERVGEHAYSSAAVYGGIQAGVEIAKILNIESDAAKHWEKAAEDIKSAMERNFWKEDFKRFIRSVRVKLNPWGGEYSNNTTIIEVNPKGYKRDVTLEDWTVDISLLGVSIPFGVYDASDDKVENTVNLIERTLTCHSIGGIKRYENDNYMGGNPWILTTLWIALYYIQRKNFAKAREFFDWAVKGKTELGLLPEQISKDDGKPAWVIPLTWSHAMFVLVLFGLLEAGEL